MRCGMPEGAASAVVGGVGSVLLQCSFKCEKRDLRVLCNRSGKVAYLIPDTARDHAARDQPRRRCRVVDRGERFDLDVFACSEFNFYHALLLSALRRHNIYLKSYAPDISGVELRNSPEKKRPRSKHNVWGEDSVRTVPPEL